MYSMVINSWIGSCKMLKKYQQLLHVYNVETQIKKTKILLVHIFDDIAIAVPNWPFLLEVIQKEGFKAYGNYI